MNSRSFSAKRGLLLLVLTVTSCTMPGLADHHQAMTGRQEQVAERGATVMPFDLEATTHIFEKSEQGGLQQVIAKDAQRFQQGDFHDPAQIHNMDMPGLHELMMGAKQINIAYSELPNGAQITYTTTAPALITALHDWFDAQVADHGQHATDHR